MAFLRSIHYLRAITISFVVAGHVEYLIFKESGNFNVTVLDLMVSNLLVGGSTQFMFIAGFLFHHINLRENRKTGQKRFEYFSFLAAKVRTVLLPYLFIALPLTFYRVFYLGYEYHRVDPEAFIQHFGSGYLAKVKQHNMWYTHVSPTVLFLWRGSGIAPTYWFIPCIMVIFALSFQIDEFLKPTTPWRLQRTVICVMFLISIIIGRPLCNKIVWQSVVYFLPVFLLGGLTSANREYVQECLTGKLLVLGSSVVLLALLQAACYPLAPRGNLHNDASSPTFPDILLLQKIVMCYFFFGFLTRFDERPARFLHYGLDCMANESFNIYLIHWWIITAYRDHLGGCQEKTGLIYLDALRLCFVSMVILAMCVVLSVLFRKTIRLLQCGSCWLIQATNNKVDKRGLPISL